MRWFLRVGWGNGGCRDLTRPQVHSGGAGGQPLQCWAAGVVRAGWDQAAGVARGNRSWVGWPGLSTSGQWEGGGALGVARGPLRRGKAQRTGDQLQCRL